MVKEHGISDQAIYGWRNHCGTPEPTVAKRLRHLKHEDQRLRQQRLVA